MTKTLAKWMTFAALLLAVAATGVWYLYQEDLPEARTMEALQLSAASRGEAKAATPAQVAGAVVVEYETEEPLDWPEGAVRGDLVLAFKTRTDLENFLREARRAGLTDLEAIPALNMLRVRTKNDEEARRALRLAGDAGVAFNPMIATPGAPPLDGIPGHYVRFGDQALAWMGVPDDNSAWGEGVRIAVLDTGIGPHPTLDGALITHMSMLDAAAQAGGVGTHGTAVASLLVGQGEVRGITPAAHLLDIQVLSGDGSGNGFDLANGIIAAVDSGANVINISAGTTTDSLALRLAVRYAQDRGIPIVAAVGNDGGGHVLYPAGYDGVVKVGAVDGNGQHAPFSNRGDISITAPGFGLIAAGENGSIVVIDGTSFAAPFVTGGIAHTDPSPQGVSILLDHADDAGPAGRDPYYGEGHMNMGRVEARDTAGIYDIAVGDFYLDRSEGFPVLWVSAQNRGTETVGNIVLHVQVDGRPVRIPVGTLAKGEVGQGAISLGSLLDTKNELTLRGEVSSPGLDDANPFNDWKEGVLRVNPQAR